MSGNRALITAGALAALGFTGALVVLPNPIRRAVFAKVDEITDDIVSAAAAAWEPS